MSAQAASVDPATVDPAVGVNEVRLVGRVSMAPVQKVLPSGDALWAFRVVVSRPAGRTRSRQKVDALECVVWSGQVKRSVKTWKAGDVVEVSGAVRRRFFRSPAGAVSRVEIEVHAGRVIRRAGTA